MRRVERVVVVELIGGMYDGRQVLLSTDDAGFPITMTLRLPTVYGGEQDPEPTLLYECLDIPERPSEDAWLFRLVP